MRILNLYAGIGGNRKLWKGHKITAVEYREDIAAVYRHYFPEDEIIVADAHEFLLQHYGDFDMIWTSRPCQTHSRARFWGHGKKNPVYPDMTLYQEIIFLDNYFKGSWIAENVKPYYRPLIPPTLELGRHLFWSNFKLSKFRFKEADIKEGDRKEWSELHGFDLSGFKINSRKDQIYRNCVHPETGLNILEQAIAALNNGNISQRTLFEFAA